MATPATPTTIPRFTTGLLRVADRHVFVVAPSTHADLTALAGPGPEARLRIPDPSDRKQSFQGRIRKPHLLSTGSTRVKYVVLSSPSGEDIKMPTALTVPSGFVTKPGLPLSPSRL